MTRTLRRGGSAGALIAACLTAVCGCGSSTDQRGSSTHHRLPAAGRAHHRRANRPRRPAMPAFVRYPQPRRVLGYRFALPPIVAIVPNDGHPLWRLYFRLNRALRPTNSNYSHPDYPVGEPEVERGGIPSRFGYLGPLIEPCYIADDIDSISVPAPEEGLPGALRPTPLPHARPGMLAHVTLRIHRGHPPLRATVPFIAALPPTRFGPVTLETGRVVPHAVSSDAPYARLLGCKKAYAVLTSRFEGHP